jgi:hypothetical protein
MEENEVLEEVKVQTPDEVREELLSESVETLVEYIFNQANIITRLNEIVNDKQYELDMANETKELYAEQAVKNIEVINAVKALVADEPVGDKLFRTGEEWLDSVLTNGGFKEEGEPNE